MKHFKFIICKIKKFELKFGIPQKDKSIWFLQLDDVRFFTNTFDKTIKDYGLLLRKKIVWMLKNMNMLMKKNLFLLIMLDSEKKFF